ncbi:MULTISPECIES: hypothetical protein [Legionella]|uniref:hypothetical protein n=1 Tax=Legionella TaxID=445 RepID=UPI000F8DA6D0|nr:MULTISPECIES: hypothetical protein [Legionella]MCP0914618.1 hypothetical protein [Legionella sp. 27cVA30]RUQ96160.1 hypothetical protein ELY11_08475 [Legionella septentrionalis]RUR09362.1 hypothetical protein ELY14_08935 [Legionella septentrionalis]RUR14312.1 hypothetical protein ELY10_09145 [Legionella septentrionalis]
MPTFFAKVQKIKEISTAYITHNKKELENQNSPLGKGFDHWLDHFNQNINSILYPNTAPQLQPREHAKSSLDGEGERKYELATLLTSIMTSIQIECETRHFKFNSASCFSFASKELLDQVNILDRVFRQIDEIPVATKAGEESKHFNNFKIKVARLKSELDAAKPVFYAYAKRLVMQELVERLTLFNHVDFDSNLRESFAEHTLYNLKTEYLNKKIINETLRLNRQSFMEVFLKILSCVSIPLGIGILTTLILIIKRHIDSQGASWNFFKPLSENVLENIEQLLDDVEEPTITTPPIDIENQYGDIDLDDEVFKAWGIEPLFPWH